MVGVSFDVESVRAAYPALSDGYSYLDGAAGTQTPQSVIDAIRDAYVAGIGNQGGAFPASARSDTIVSEARAAVADLVGGVPDGVIFGPNMTTLTYRLAGALAKHWRPGDNVVLSRLDHDANVRPWVQVAERVGAEVRWAMPDVKTGELPVAQYDELLDERTRLVAFTAASNILGTRPDVAGITAKAHAVGALAYIDGVHATPHCPVDVSAYGADFYATSAYKWSGPHIGAVIADPATLDGLHPDKLLPAPDSVPSRFEAGTHALADLAGVTAAVEHLAGLAAPAAATGASRRQRVLASMTAVSDYEQALFGELLAGLAKLPGVRLYGSAANRTATAFFNIEGHEPRAVAEFLADHRVNVWSGISYAWEPAGVLGIRDSGGAVRAGLVHYNNGTDVERLLNALARLTG